MWAGRGEFGKHPFETENLMEWEVTQARAMLMDFDFRLSLKRRRRRQRVAPRRESHTPAGS
jgi:hypothetical protein